MYKAKNKCLCIKLIAERGIKSSPILFVLNDKKNSEVQFFLSLTRPSVVPYKCSLTDNCPYKPGTIFHLFYTFEPHPSNYSKKPLEDLIKMLMVSLKYNSSILRPIKKNSTIPESPISSSTLNQSKPTS